MNVQLPVGQVGQSVASKPAIADGDIHPVRKSRTDLYPFLSKRWREHLETFGPLPRQGSQAGQWCVFRRKRSGFRSKAIKIPLQSDQVSG